MKNITLFITLVFYHSIVNADSGVATPTVPVSATSSSIPSYAMDDFFKPSISNMLSGASAFATYFHDYSAAMACYNDPACGMPSDPNAGFDLPPSSCCENSVSCLSAYNEAIRKVDVSLFTLYKNEKTYRAIMQVQSARMTAMKGAGSMSPIGGAAVARMEIDIAKAKKGFIAKFNTKTQHNISRLNEFLLELGTINDNSCQDTGWYQRYGMPVYIHAKIKFPK